MSLTPGVRFGVYVRALGSLAHRVLTGSDQLPRRTMPNLDLSDDAYRVPFQDAPHAGFLFDEETLAIVEVNQAACALYGYTRDEFLRMSILDIRPPDDVPLLKERVRHLRQLPVSWSESTHRKKDGVVISVEISSMVVRVGARRLVLALVHDQSERLRLEEQLRQAQKMEALGVLAGGIAHDFNNLLTSVLGYANLASTAVAADSPVRQMLREIETAAERGADLTHQMLAYAGRGEFVLQVLRLDSVVTEMIALLRTVISRNAAIELDLRPAALRGDATQIRQIVMNLITNASDALGDQQGQITIRTGMRQLDEEASSFMADEPLHGRHAFLEVADTGCGMSEDTIGKIFDPFFTTKFAGRGLGLAAVQGIVRREGGGLRVRSTPGAGSTFAVVFPAADEVPEDAGPPADTAAPAAGSGTVLVVEDEEDVRRFVLTVLEDAGFRVLIARDGLDGLTLFRASRHDIRVILLDLTMPRMNGWQLAREVQALEPDVPIVMMSGYTQPDSPAGGPVASLAGFIQKPFRARELKELVCRLAPAED